MRQINIKKLVIPNIPYFVLGLYASKLGEAWRLAEGADASQKLLHIMDGLAATAWSTAQLVGGLRRTLLLTQTRCSRTTSFLPRRRA